MQNIKTKILFVAMPEAIHTARWIAQLDGQGWDIHLFPSRDTPPILEMPALTFHSLFPSQRDTCQPEVRNEAIIPWRYHRGQERIRQTLARCGHRLATAAGQLAYVIDRLQPDIVHTMEMQLAGYLMYDALENLRQEHSFKWIYSCWGNDITFYHNQPEHRRRIKKVLNTCDYYTADCPRDIRLIESFAPKASALPVYPTGGGYDIQKLKKYRSAGPTSNRRVIALKGYHDEDWTGRALIALQAVEQCADDLRDYEIVIYRANDCVRYAAEYLARARDMKFTVLPYWVDNVEVIKLLGASRIAISTNSGDGTPNAMLESMLMGAFPIQSNTADTEGWINDGLNGLLVPFDDIDAIAAAIRKAVNSDQLVDDGALVSDNIICEKLDYSSVQDAVIKMYNTIHCGYSPTAEFSPNLKKTTASNI